MPDPANAGGPLKSEFAGDPEMMELVREFVQELPERISTLQCAWREANAELVGRVAHQLKGASAGYGFTPVGEAAANLEKAIKSVDDDLTRAKREFDELLALCNRASAEA
jgi:HPt (histidine-containing phosphotransfer) domain-containing protein